MTHFWNESLLEMRNGFAPLTFVVESSGSIRAKTMTGHYSRFTPREDNVVHLWWDINVVIDFELLETNQTMTADFYSRQLQRVHEALACAEP
jgi:hypothetical protein